MKRCRWLVVIPIITLIAVCATPLLIIVAFMEMLEGVKAKV